MQDKNSVNYKNSFELKLKQEMQDKNINNTLLEMQDKNSVNYYYYITRNAGQEMQDKKLFNHVH